MGRRHPTLVTGWIATSAKGGTSNQSHHGHGAQPAHQSNRHWSPTDAVLCMSVPPTLFPICALRLSTRNADATQSSSSAHITSRSAETEISSAWQYRRTAEDFHSHAAKMTPIGEPAAASEVALPVLNALKVHLFASLWPNSVSMRRTTLRNEELVRSKRVAPVLLIRSSGATACTAQQCGGRFGAGASTHQQAALWSVFPSGQPDVEEFKASFA